jgi:CubicO group peptidase (beta-lactamase class C family)
MHLGDRRGGGGADRVADQEGQGGVRAVLVALLAFLPGLAGAAPDEEQLGKNRYAPCPRPEGSFAAPECIVWMMSHYDVAFTARVVKAGDSVRPLKRAAAEPPLGIDAFLAAHRNTGLLILQGDTVLAERYQYERKPEHRFASMSMAKTVIGMLVGIALHEGHIRSLDDPAERYVPALKGHPYGETPVRHLLTMSSGVKFVENYLGNDDIMKLGRQLLFHTGPGGPQALAPFRERVAPPGKVFSYASSETFVLGLVLRGATGMSVADYLSEKIWRPMGAEADASMNIDASGHELAYCCVNATLRDWARLGLLLAEGGGRDGRQIIPGAWVREATSNKAPMTGYGYQTWVSPQGDRFTLRGLRGQAVDVHPASRTVVVHTAVYTVGSGRQGQQSFFDSVLTSLAR